MKETFGVDTEERLVAEFSAAVLKSILLHGRLYVFEKRLVRGREEERRGADMSRTEMRERKRAQSSIKMSSMKKGERSVCVCVGGNFCCHKNIYTVVV